MEDLLQDSILVLRVNHTSGRQETSALVPCQWLDRYLVPTGSFIQIERALPMTRSEIQVTLHPRWMHRVYRRGTRPGQPSVDSQVT